VSGRPAEYRQAVTIITKNRLVTRDLDLLSELARHDAAGVFVSVTSLDEEPVGRFEPRTTRPASSRRSPRWRLRAFRPA
jgi:DNA repair photolyase